MPTKLLIRRRFCGQGIVCSSAIIIVCPNLRQDWKRPGRLIAGGAGTPSAASSAPATASVEEVINLVVREQNARPSSSEISETKNRRNLGRGLAQRSCSQPHQPGVDPRRSRNWPRALSRKDSCSRLRSGRRKLIRNDRGGKEMAAHEHLGGNHLGSNFLRTIFRRPACL